MQKFTDCISYRKHWALYIFEKHYLVVELFYQQVACIHSYGSAFKYKSFKGDTVVKSSFHPFHLPYPSTCTQTHIHIHVVIHTLTQIVARDTLFCPFCSLEGLSWRSVYINMRRLKNVHVHIAFHCTVVPS